MQQLMKLFGANFKTTFREKQVWFWSIFYPVLLLVVLLMIFGGANSDDADFKAKIALVAGQQGAWTERMEQALKQVPVLEWKQEGPVSRSQAEEWVKNKDIDAAIVLPEGDSGKQIELLINREKQNSSTAQVLGGIMRDMATQMNFAEAGIQPELSVTMNYLSSGSSKIKYSDFLLTGLIALSICQAGLFGMVGMVEMRRNGLLKRLRMTPVNIKMFGLSNILVRFILSAIQVVLLALIGLLFYHARLDFNVPAFLVMFLVGTVSFAAVGFMIASLSKSMDSYFGISNLISFVMMFLSGIFFDYSMLPDYIKPLSDVLPLTYFANGIRDSMVYGLSMAHASFWINLGILAAWGLVTFWIGSRFYNWRAETK